MAISMGPSASKALRGSFQKVLESILSGWGWGPDEDWNSWEWEVFPLKIVSCPINIASWWFSIAMLVISRGYLCTSTAFFLYPLTSTWLAGKPTNWMNFYEENHWYRVHFPARHVWLTDGMVGDDLQCSFFYIFLVSMKITDPNLSPCLDTN